MSSEEAFGQGVLCCGVAMTIIGVFFLGLMYTCVAESKDEHWRSEAVKAGKAEYYLDANNQRQWRWKP